MDLESIGEWVRTKFQMAEGFAPYYAIGRILLPPNYQSGGVVVPIDANT